MSGAQGWQLAVPASRALAQVECTGRGGSSSSARALTWEKLLQCRGKTGKATNHVDKNRRLERNREPGLRDNRQTLPSDLQEVTKIPLNKEKKMRGIALASKQGQNLLSDTTI